MKFARTPLFAVVLWATLTGIGQGAAPTEPLLRDLPPGIAVESSTEVPKAQTKAIGQKLGGDLQRLTNSIIRVHGRPIQVNVIQAVDEGNAKVIHAGLSKVKSHPFCVRKGSLVVEYVGRNIDAALATKASYEIGIVEKPTNVRYRVTADVATIETADYMACNTLFKHFIALQDGNSKQAAQQIGVLSKKFTFGHELSLRNPSLGGVARIAHSLKPQPDHSTENGAVITYAFGELRDRHEIPFVTLKVDTTVGPRGFLESAKGPAEHLTAATPFWPADDPAIVNLAQRITAGKQTNGAKAMAILKWLEPGQNLKYSGKTGSRWGTAQVLEQKFGHCWDFSDCFVTLARAADVPSRQVAGWLYGSSGHVWAEFYREGKGWQQVDPTGGGKLMCGIYHIPIFTSEDGEMPVLYLGMPKVDVVSQK